MALRRTRSMEAFSTLDSTGTEDDHADTNSDEGWNSDADRTMAETSLWDRLVELRYSHDQGRRIHVTSGPAVVSYPQRTNNALAYHKRKIIDNKYYVKSERDDRKMSREREMPCLRHSVRSIEILSLSYRVRTAY